MKVQKVPKERELPELSGQDVFIVTDCKPHLLGQGVDDSVILVNVETGRSYTRNKVSRVDVLQPEEYDFVVRR